MKNRHHHLINALELLNPVAEPAKGKITQLCLRQQNGDSLFVDEVIVQMELGMIYARSTSEDPIWHMVPVDELVGLEVALNDHPTARPWFKDAEVLPAIIAKLGMEKKKAGK